MPLVASAGCRCSNKCIILLNYDVMGILMIF